MVRWWNGLVKSYGETNMAKWCREYTPMLTWLNGEMVKWWDGEMDWYKSMVKNMVKWCTEYTPMFTWWNGDLVKWCGANNTKVKWCNGETIILTFDSRWFLGLLQRWGPIPLLQLIGCCITHWWKIRLWMMPRWLSKRNMSLWNTLLCRTPLLLSDKFLILILPFIRPTTTNTRGVHPLWNLPVSCHCSLYLY